MPDLGDFLPCVASDAGSWSCSGGTQDGASVSLALGQSATCTIDNNDNAPGLHLRKIVINDNGGTATAADFTLTATGPTTISGTSPVDSGPSFDAGTYALSDSAVAGYASSAWVCVGGTQNGRDITVGLGESATCTITNNDIPPKPHRRKVVINDNGGTKTVADFTLTANGTGANDLSGTTPVDSGAGLQADTWALSETNVYGYTASAWSWVGGTQNGSNITVGIGGEATSRSPRERARRAPGPFLVRPASSLASGVELRSASRERPLPSGTPRACGEAELTMVMDHGLISPWRRSRSRSSRRPASRCCSA